MASVRLSYGEDLQMDWDGRGRLLVKVGRSLPKLQPPWG